MSAARFPFRTASRLGHSLALPVTICQDIPTLLRFEPDAFSYELDVPSFVRYFERRTGVKISRAGGYGPTDRPCTPEEWAQRRAQLHRHSTDPDIVARIHRARLQDAWEIYHFQLGFEEGAVFTIGNHLAKPKPNPAPAPKPTPSPLQLAFDF